MNEAKDVMRELAVKQGYVPAKCTLPGILLVAIIKDGKDPCDGCPDDRTICKGRKETR